MKTLQEMSSKELKVLGKEKHIKNWWSLSKTALIEAIEALDPQKQQFKDKCDGCGKMAVLQSFDGKLLCDECIEKMTSEEVKEEPLKEDSPVLKETTEPEQVKEAKKPKAAKRASLKINELTYKGKTQSIKKWAEELNMPWPTLYDRINRNGWEVEEAIETPLGQRRKKK